jgi:membrane-anchored protein YejM (alkaline phosphatase superfamily)
MALLKPQPGVLYREQVSRLISWGHWFTFFNIILALVISSRYILANPWPETNLGVAYLFVSWIGHFSFIGFVTYLVTLFPLSFLFPNQKLMRNISVILAVIILTVLLLDTQIYHVFKFHINPTVWTLLLEEAQSKSELNWNFLYIVIPIIFLIELVISNYSWRRQLYRKKQSSGIYIASTLVICFSLMHLTYMVADARLYEPITSQRANFPLSYPMTARTFLAKHGWLDLDKYRTKAEKAEKNEFVKQRVYYPLAPLRVEPSTDKMNILLVVVSGLRADTVNTATMPFLTDFASKHLNFSQHVAGDNNQNASLFSLFYGLPAAYRGSFSQAEQSPLLIDELLRQDYNLSAFTSFGLNQDLYRKNIFHNVRQISRLRNEQQPHEDAATLEHWQSWLDKQTNERPWFSYINLSMPEDMSFPDSFQGPFQPDFERNRSVLALNQADPQKLVNHYRNAAYYSDGQIHQIIAALEQKAALTNTVVVITSDHGLELNDTRTNTWGSGSNYSTYQMQVPLIIAWPGKNPQRVDNLTSHTDIVPTLLSDVLGVRNDAGDYSTGENLFGPKKHDWVLLGGNTQYVIYDLNTATIFNRQGDFNIFTRRTYQAVDDNRPDMAILLQVMKDLTRFKDGGS